MAVHLNPEQVAEIVELLRNTHETQREIANRFGVATLTIGNIKRGEQHCGITGGPVDRPKAAQGARRLEQYQIDGIYSLLDGNHSHADIAETMRVSLATVERFATGLKTKRREIVTPEQHALAVELLGDQLGPALKDIADFFCCTETALTALGIHRLDATITEDEIIQVRALIQGCGIGHWSAIRRSYKMEHADFKHIIATAAPDHKFWNFSTLPLHVERTNMRLDAQNLSQMHIAPLPDVQAKIDEINYRRNNTPDDEIVAQAAVAESYVTGVDRP